MPRNQGENFKSYVKRNKLEQIHAYVPQATKEMMVATAKKMDMSLSQLLVYAVENVIAHELNRDDVDRVLNTFQSVNIFHDKQRQKDWDGNFTAKEFICYYNDEDDPDYKDKQTFYKFNNLICEYIFSVRLEDNNNHESLYVTIYDAMNVDRELKPFIITKEFPKSFPKAHDIKANIQQLYKGRLYSQAYDLFLAKHYSCKYGEWVPVEGFEWEEYDYLEDYLSDHDPNYHISESYVNGEWIPSKRLKKVPKEIQDLL